MRILATLLAMSALTAAEPERIAIGQWNGMLLVTAPAGHDVSRLRGRLVQKITLDVRDQPLTDIAEFLRRVTALNIVVAPALQADPPLLTLQVRDMALGNVLTWIGQVSGTHVGVLDGAIYLSDQPVAGASRTRLYDISDLTMPIRDFPGPQLGAPQAAGGGLALVPANDHGVARYDPDQLAALLERMLAAGKAP